MTDGNDLKMFMLKEIDVIEQVITRMAHCSFMIKGWAVTLVVAALLLKGERLQVFVAYIPLLVFWYLDAYYLWQERMYRKLYEWVVDKRRCSDELLFDMNARRFEGRVHSKCRIMVSTTLAWFYVPLAVLTTVYIVYLSVTQSGGC